MSIMHDAVADTFGFAYVEGGVAAARGFSAAGVHAGFREEPERDDLALVLADGPCAAAGVFTENAFCAAPVQVCREHLCEDATCASSYGTARAVVVNSGVANAATGREGLEVARRTAAFVAEAAGCAEEEVLVASTGLIGVQLPFEPFETGVPAALDVIEAARTAADAPAALIDGAAHAACAIMTTDTHSKECAVTFSGDDVGYPSATFTVGGMAKGAGMIMPDMATMIAVITTDVPVRSADLHEALRTAVRSTFNRVTVDGDTSTNDTCLLLASGAAADAAPIEPGSDAWHRFESALLQVCTALSRAIAADGEGSTRLVSVNVRGAASDQDADAAARAVANSPLVKTAVYGNDANWGRIAAALGRSGARFSQENVDIALLGIPVCKDGLGLAFDEDEMLARFRADEIDIDVDLGAGTCKATVWTCDLTHDYITINGDYRT